MYSSTKESSTNRHTQLDLLALANHASPPNITNEAILHDSPYAKTDNKVLTKHRGPDTTVAPEEPQLRTAKAVSHKLRASPETPWRKYEIVYDVELGSTIHVAIRKDPPVELVQVRVFKTHTSVKTLQLFRKLQHQNLVTAIEAFTTDSSLYVILEYMPISLDWIVRSPAYPNDRQLAAIIGQVVAGLAYLANEGYEHESLTCSNILLNTNGDVKIANQECCSLITEPIGKRCDIRALSFITMELMQKYVKEGGAIGIDNLDRWPSRSDALGFLSATTSVVSAGELLKHPFLSHPYRKDSLIGIVSLAQVSIRGRYKYTARE